MAACQGEVEYAGGPLPFSQRAFFAREGAACKSVSEGDLVFLQAAPLPLSRRAFFAQERPPAKGGKGSLVFFAGDPLDVLLEGIFCSGGGRLRTSAKGATPLPLLRRVFFSCEIRKFC
jgi:hypothetical protein